VAVIVLTGSPEFFPMLAVEGMTVLGNPVSEAALLAHLRHPIDEKVTR